MRSDDAELTTYDGLFENLNLGAKDKESVLGRALVLHSSDGNGARVACGVIGRRQEPQFELPAAPTS